MLLTLLEPMTADVTGQPGSLHGKQERPQRETGLAHLSREREAGPLPQPALGTEQRQRTARI